MCGPPRGIAFPRTHVTKTAILPPEIRYSLPVLVDKIGTGTWNEEALFLVQNSVSFYWRHPLLWTLPKRFFGVWGMKGHRNIQLEMVLGLLAF